MGKDLLSMSQQFSGLPMEDLIGAPLNATAKANVEMVLAQTKILLDTCFSCCNNGTCIDPATGMKYNPVMIEMSLERSGVVDDKNNKPQMDVITTKFNIPLLTLIPINSPKVNSVDVSFEMVVMSNCSETDHQKQQSESMTEMSTEGKLGWGIFSVSDKDTTSCSLKDSATNDTRYERNNTKKSQLQSISCPICNTAIPFEINPLLQGERFKCPKCEATISLLTESRPQVQNAIDKLNNIKQSNDLP